MWGRNPQESAEIVASGCPWGDEDGGEALCDASSDGSITDFAEFFFAFFYMCITTWMENKPHMTMGESGVGSGVSRVWSHKRGGGIF